SSGFDTKADEYIRSFNLKIRNEPSLEKWTNAILKKYSLLHLSFKKIKDKLQELLASLTVKPIVPNDIQDLLNAYKSITVRRFFEVQIVVDNSELNSIKSDIEELKTNSRTKPVSVDKIVKEFGEASLFLSNYKNSFSLLNPLKIERRETVEIIQWIQKPLKDKEESILIIKGGAGCGKSVILNNTYQLLVNKGIPAIGLKADEINADSIEELDKKIGLSESLQNSVERISMDYPKVIIILDQLDALSQSL